MSAPIVPKTATIIPAKKPSGTRIQWLIHETTKEEAIVFNSDAADGFTALGKVTLAGADEASLAGYTLGWIQVQLMETQWAVYRGREESHGSIFVNNGWKPAFPICRDGGDDPQDLLYDAEYADDAKFKNRATVPRNAGKKIQLTCEFRDFPNQQFELFMTNPVTKAKNYIDEAALELYFCTVLTLLKPDKTFEHLKHVYWGIGWHCRFTPPDAKGVPGVHPVKGYKHSGKVCSVLDGAPTDARIKDNLTAAKITTCNVRASEREPVADSRKDKNAVFNTTGATRSKDKSTEKYSCFK
jgi:hypothetical protein